MYSVSEVSWMIEWRTIREDQLILPDLTAGASTCIWFLDWSVTGNPLLLHMSCHKVPFFRAGVREEYTTCKYIHLSLCFDIGCFVSGLVINIHFGNFGYCMTPRHIHKADKVHMVTMSGYSLCFRLSDKIKPRDSKFYNSLVVQHDEHLAIAPVSSLNRDGTSHHVAIVCLVPLHRKKRMWSPGVLCLSQSFPCYCTCKM